MNHVRTAGRTLEKFLPAFYVPETKKTFSGYSLPPGAFGVTTLRLNAFPWHSPRHHAKH